MRIYDQIISIVTQYNRGVSSSTLPGEATSILVVYPLLLLSALGLFVAACEFYWQRPNAAGARNVAGALACGIIAALAGAFVLYVWMCCSCDGYAIYLRPVTAGQLCGARGGDAISLKPLFEGRVKLNEAEKNDRVTEVIRGIDALISLSVEASVMTNSTPNT